MKISFYAFSATNGHTYYFAARSKDELLKATNGGKHHGGVPIAGNPKFIECKQVDEAEVRNNVEEYQLQYIQTAREFLARPSSKTYWVGKNKTE